MLAHGRGTVGETALHLLFLMNTPHHRRLIRLLVPWLGRQEVLDANGSTVSMLNASYLGQPYNGEVALHFAVIQQDLEMVKLLVENGATTKHLKGDRQGQNIHANGSFAYSNTDLYFGGTILGFAACLGNVDIVDYLVRLSAGCPSSKCTRFPCTLPPVRPRRLLARDCFRSRPPLPSARHTDAGTTCTLACAHAYARKWHFTTPRPPRTANRVSDHTTTAHRVSDGSRHRCERARPGPHVWKAQVPSHGDEQHRAALLRLA